MPNSEIISLIIIILCLALAFFCVIISKRKGKKCTGCPYSNKCSKQEKENSNNCGR